MAIQLNFQCDESWDKMTNISQGKFCAKCTKNIYDLSNKTEKEIHQLYQKNNGKLCGKIKPHQLSNFNYRKQRAKLAKFCLTLYLVFGGYLFKAELHAQNNNIDSNSTAINGTKKYYTITGTVTDKETKEPIFAANIYYTIGSKNFGTISDFDGVYKLKIDASLIKKPSIELFFSSIGYKKTNIEFSTKNQTKLNVKLDYDAEIMLLGMINYDKHDSLINRDPESHGKTIITGDDIRRSPY